MKLLYTIFIFSIILFSFRPNEYTLNGKEIRVLLGDTWKGEVSYFDDQSNQELSEPVELTIRQPDQLKSRWIFEYTYPKRPQANSKEVINLNKDGTKLDGEVILKKTVLQDKTLQVITEKVGKDNGKKAKLRYTYLLGPSTFSVQQMVIYTDRSKALVRNTFRFSR